MRIGVELINSREGIAGGLVPLLQGVLTALFAGWPEHEVVLFCNQDNRPLFGAPPAQVQPVYLPSTAAFPLLDVYAFQFGLDVLLRASPYVAELVFPLARQIILIPDLQHEYYPEFFPPNILQQRRAAFAEALGRAGAIATLSEHGRQTLLAHPAARARHPQEPLDIFLMPPAALMEPGGSQAAGLTEVERALLPQADFFLYPANLWPHKNHRRVFAAFARFLKSADRPLEFVFTGHPDGWDELVKDFPGLPVRHVGFVSRRLLQALLSRARALIFFSLFEGFGMPLLEAFATGVPVACSDCTSLPEVGGDAVLTCDPTDVVAMSAAMARVSADEELRSRLIARGKQRLQHYHWHDSAAQLVAACARLAARPRTVPQTPVAAVHRLNRVLGEIETDRAARLERIHRLEAEQTARLERIHRLEAELAARLDVIHRLKAALDQAEAQRGLAGIWRRAARRLFAVVRRP